MPNNFDSNDCSVMYPPSGWTSNSSGLWDDVSCDQSKKCLCVQRSINTERELTYSAAFYNVVELGSSIQLSETMQISERNSLTINGNGFAIDENYIVRCLWINSSVVYLNDLTISRGYAYDGGGLYAMQSLVYMARCTVVNNAAVGTHTLQFYEL